ncbi:shikimate dehydrogenase [Asaia bogorensis]|uniref:Shikimate dehydrogenase (NADP(+)) n=1 Tax=Asaia bogorensis NBRC 16594 TaxID=1231624 RepID=A0AAN4R217_9PROT|nr:shikimate dehydrogenase [Asaia bogorensis]BAT18700.1 shikimate 5-dehydrogenase [Asaia bogorensis NBRC 16594]GBQ75612.1 shikimate 5-dehydrogenase [Asaia bogorensis NBRC 16594]GEL53055.1 shikimate dehydrogenase (NADP(+)) [Asaia bogorensis NBRC 16594]
MTDRSFRSTLTGSFSTPCAKNPTVAMMEAGYAKAGIDARYINCDVKPENLAAAIAGAKAMEWAGFNCSIPHKIAVIDHLDNLAESAKIIGAVNCVQIRDGKLTGNNTDGKGFLASLRKVTEPKGKTIVILGAGGAARAIAVELALAGAARITIANRSPDKAQAIARLLTENSKVEAHAMTWEGEFVVPEGTDVLINATSIGLGDAEAIPAVKISSLGHAAIVADVIPNPPMTKLLREAKAQGCQTLDGLGMLVNQGIIGAELVLGAKLSPDVMEKTLATLFRAQD